MKLQIERPVIKKNKRVIAISDVHGNLTALKALLEKVSFTREDVLVLLGDVVEKGPQSLDTLHYVMELRKTHTVYYVCGNCDMIALELFREEKNEELLTYLCVKQHTLVGEMCHAAGLTINRQLDMKKAKAFLRECFREELEYIRSLPHVLILNDYVFAHAATRPEGLSEMKPSQVMKADAFMNLGYYFTKYQVVGHWPVVLYCDKIPNCNPRVDKKAKIISIDGANVLKPDGQLNALIIPDTGVEQFDYTYVDSLPRARAVDTQEEGEDSFIIPWLHNEVRVLRAETELSYCEQIFTGKKMWIPNSYLYQKKDKSWATEDITDYQLKVTSGDVLSIIKKTSRGILVKKDGISGWYYGRIEKL